MMSPLLALFNRSLRQDVRAKSTYWARVGLAAIMCVMMMTNHMSMGWAGAPGLVFFTTVIYTNYFCISLAGLSFFASAITEEKEEMTLGLLRMTNLNPLSILLGKSTSRLFSGLLLLAVQLPFTFLAVSLGGVSLTQILAAYCALMGYVVFLSNLALLASVICARTAGAAVLTGFFLVNFVFGYYFVLGIVYVLNWIGLISSGIPGSALQTILDGWQTLVPFTRLSEVLNSGFSGGLLGPHVYGNLALGALCFVLAWTSFDFFCRDMKDAAPRRPFFRAGLKTAGFYHAFRAFHAGRPWKHALAWKDYHFSSGGNVMAFARLLLYAVLPFLGVIIVNSPRSDTNSLETYGYTYIWSMLVILLVELSLTAGSIFRQERRWQTLSSLAMLPVSMRRIAYQKVLGGLLASWPAFLLFLLGCFLLFLSSPQSIFHFFRFWPVTWSAISFLAQVLFFLHLVADLSLRFKWGALPMAVAIVTLLNMILLPISFLILRELSVAAIPLGTIVATIVLHFRIGARLQQLAGEE